MQQHLGRFSSTKCSSFGKTKISKTPQMPQTILSKGNKLWDTASAWQPESPDLKSIKSLWTWRWPRSNKHSFNWNVSSFVTFSRSKCQMHSNNKFKVSKCSVTFSSIYPFGEHTSTLPEMGNVIIVNYILTFFYSKNSDWNDCRDIQSYVKRCVNKSKQKLCFRELS